MTKMSTTTHTLQEELPYSLPLRSEQSLLPLPPKKQ